MEGLHVSSIVLNYPHHVAIIHDQYDLPAKDHPM
jgi:hypothetical protein